MYSVHGMCEELSEERTLGIFVLKLNFLKKTCTERHGHMNGSLKKVGDTRTE